MSGRSAIAWSYLGQFGSMAATFAGTVIVTRLLSPVELGIYALAVATVGIIQIVSAMGLSALVVRDAHLDDERLSAVFSANLLIAVVLSACILACSESAWVTGGDARVSDVLRLLAVVPVIGSVGFRPMSMFQRNLMFRELTLTQTVAAVIGTSVTVGAAYRGLSYFSPAWGAIATEATTGLLSSLVGRRFVGFGLSRRGWGEIFSFGLRMMTIGGVSTLAMRASEVVLGRVLGLEALGYYSRASSLANMIFQNVYGASTRVVFPQMSQVMRETGVIGGFFLRSLSMILAFMWPALLGLAVLSRPVVVLLFGERWLPTAPILSILMVAQVFTLAFGMNWELFVIRNETARQTKYEVVRSIAGLVFFVIGCQYNLIGAALGRVVDSLTGLVFYFGQVKRLAEVGNRDILVLYRDGAVLSAAAVLPSLALMLATGWDAGVSIPLLAAGIALGGVIWLAALRGLRHPLFAEIARLGGRRGLVTRRH